MVAVLPDPFDHPEAWSKETHVHFTGTGFDLPLFGNGDPCNHSTDLPYVTVTFNVEPWDQGYYFLTLNGRCNCGTFETIAVQMFLDGLPTTPGLAVCNGDVSTLDALSPGILAASNCMVGSWAPTGIGARIDAARGPRSGCHGFWLPTGTHVLKLAVQPWTWWVDFDSSDPCDRTRLYQMDALQLVYHACSSFHLPYPGTLIRLVHGPEGGTVRFTVPAGSTGRLKHHG